jgi:hypothetical protein
MFGPESLERPYKGYRIEGGAQSQGPNSNLWLSVATVLLKKPDGTLLQVDQYRDPLLAYESGDLAAWFGLGVAEILVDHCLPPSAHYLQPMTVERAVDILRRGAEDHDKREIRRPELYDALTFLDKLLEKKNWLVRRYRNALRGDTRNRREKMERREELRVRFRGIQQACVEALVVEMNKLALRFRKNKPVIDKLRQLLASIRRPVGK